MELIVFSGVQGSGKTSFYLERFFHSHVRISLDLVGTRNREDILLHACLAAQQPVVVDNTNVTVKARNRLAALGRAAGFKTILYLFETSLDDALTRNAARPEALRVPDLAVRGTFAKFEATGDEGFDQTHRVRIREHGFEVERVYEIRRTRRADANLRDG